LAFNRTTRPLRVVHLPVYRDNAYQPLLMTALARQGIEVIDGGGGGTFLRTALTKWKPDVIHFHWLHPYLIRSTVAGTLARGVRLLIEVLILRLFGVRIVWTLHNLQNHDRKHVRLERWLTRAFVRLTDRVIAHCPAAERLGRAQFADRRRGRWVVIPHGSYVGCYPDEIARREARARLNLPPDGLVFLFFGRIQPYKGVLELIATFRAANLSNARLVIAGRPADPEADRLVTDAVAGSAAIAYRPGFVPDDEVQVLMRASDVVVLPFRDVLTSSSVLLAMSFGRAVIAPRLGCVPETVAAGTDLLYCPGDRDGLARALGGSATRAPELAEIGAANRRAAEAFPWDRVATMTAHTYAPRTPRPTLPLQHPCATPNPSGLP
jgi:glycosyltransferase involved in cell wall biosynthesis